jgi:hypothetical protein
MAQRHRALSVNVQTRSESPRGSKLPLADDGAGGFAAITD